MKTGPRFLAKVVLVSFWTLAKDGTRSDWPQPGKGAFLSKDALRHSGPPESAS
jgi:hypothetical protein